MLFDQKSQALLVPVANGWDKHINNQTDKRISQLIDLIGLEGDSENRKKSGNGTIIGVWPLTCEMVVFLSCCLVVTGVHRKTFHSRELEARGLPLAMVLVPCQRLTQEEGENLYI